MRSRIDVVGDQCNSVSGTSLNTNRTNGTQSSFRSLSRRGKLIASKSSDQESNFHPQLSTGSLMYKSKKKAKPKRAAARENLSQTIHGVLNGSMHTHGVLNASMHTKSSHGTKSTSGDTDVSRSIPSGSMRRSLKVAPVVKANLSKLPRERMSIYSKRDDDDASEGTTGSINRTTSTAQLFQLICWACEQLNYPYELAGSLMPCRLTGRTNNTSFSQTL
jgi:hypothetical protein